MHAKTAIESMDEVTIIGGGIAGALHAYHVYREAAKNDKSVRITIFEKNQSIAETTTVNQVLSLKPDENIAAIPRGKEMSGSFQVALNETNELHVDTILLKDHSTPVAHIVPSLTPDELLSVVPRGAALVEKLKIPFNQPGGIRIDDVEGLNHSDVSSQFIEQAEIYSQDLDGYHDRTKTLLALGKMSMGLWQKMYDEADNELKEILKDSNYNPCCELLSGEEKSLHKGYRIDLIYSIADAASRAKEMKADYESLGYKNCAILSPIEVMAIDPFLSDFCHMHSQFDERGNLQWNDDSVALWRPGGCIDTRIFLPKFYDYLKKVMGTYVDKSGKICNHFEVLYEKEVIGVEFGEKNKKTVVSGLDFGKGFMKLSDASCQDSLYIFCPGESVGMLKKLGLKEPAFAGFAGVSLLLNISLPEEMIATYSHFSHCMEVHQEGVVLAWQARFIDGKIFIGVGGTKAFYGDQRPTKDQAFAKDRNLLQLNMINDVLPEFISLALGRNTTGQTLSQADIDLLEYNGIAERWAGIRSVVFDRFPTLGLAYRSDGVEIDNAIVTTHLGSGGVSFGPAVVFVSHSAKDNQEKDDSLVNRVLNYSKSNRSAE